MPHGRPCTRAHRHLDDTLSIHKTQHDLACLQQPVQPLQSIIVVKRIVRPSQPVQILAGLQTETKILAISQNAHLHVP